MQGEVINEPHRLDVITKIGDRPAGGRGLNRTLRRQLGLRSPTLACFLSLDLMMIPQLEQLNASLGTSLTR